MKITSAKNSQLLSDSIFLILCAFTLIVLVFTMVHTIETQEELEKLYDEEEKAHYNDPITPTYVDPRPTTENFDPSDGTDFVASMFQNVIKNGE